MGRLIAKRYVVKGRLVAITPIHVGGAFGELVTDMPLARDGAGRCYIPGTSLAGPIRRWWSRRRSDSEMPLVFGRIPEGRRDTQADDDGKDAGHASYLIVDDAPVVGAAASETRDGVGIDRETGAAAEGIKYDREVLPCGTAFDFRMEVDVATGIASVVPARPADATESAQAATPGKPGKRELPRPDGAATEKSLGALIRALEDGRIRFGAAKTRGLGCLKLQDATVVMHELGSRAGMLRRLRDRADERQDVRHDLLNGADADRPAAEIDIVVAWHAELPVMSKSEAAGVTVDALPLVAADGAALSPIIPGASWKGALRAHAERICRTLAKMPPPPIEAEGGTGRKRNLAQEFLDDLAACELVEALFGARATAGKSRNKQSDIDEDDGPPLPGLGALSVDDCVIGPKIEPHRWRDLVTNGATEADQKTVTARTLLEAAGWSDFRAATHVAIDRWTGGAAKNLLFSGIEPATGGARELRLHFDLDRLAQRGTDPQAKREDACAAPDLSVDEFRKAAFGLLLVTLRELAKGRIPVGYGATRGLGSIAIDDIAFHLTGAAAANLGLGGTPDGGNQAPQSFSLVQADFDSATAMARFGDIDKAWRTYWPDGTTP